MGCLTPRFNCERSAGQGTLLARSASSLRVGAAGLLYCSDTHSFTTPFLVYSRPYLDRTIRSVWPEEWILPFRIHALGSPEKQLTLDEARKVLPVLRDSGKTNPSHVLNLAPTTAFAPSNVSDEDWEILLVELGQ
jgi:hypothetical protein